MLWILSSDSDGMSSLSDHVNHERYGSPRRCDHRGHVHEPGSVLSFDAPLVWMGSVGGVLQVRARRDARPHRSVEGDVEPEALADTLRGAGPLPVALYGPGRADAQDPDREDRGKDCLIRRELDGDIEAAVRYAERVQSLDEGGPRPGAILS